MFLLLVTDINKYKNIIKSIENKEYKSLKSVISLHRLKYTLFKLQIKL